MSKKKNNRTIIDNRKARHNYNILEYIEAGIVLSGTEIKSIRSGTVNLSDAYARISNEEVFLSNMYIKHYEQGNRYNKDEYRERKLLLHKKEIQRLLGKIKEKGYTLIPVNLHWSRDKVKVDLGLCKSKKLHDKRDDLKQKDADRDIERAMSGKY